MATEQSLSLIYPKQQFVFSESGQSLQPQYKLDATSLIPVVKVRSLQQRQGYKKEKEKTNIKTTGADNRLKIITTKTLTS